MAILLDSKLIEEKNRLHGGSPFLLLLDIKMPGVGENARVVLNTEDITWRGKTWKAIPFQLEEITQGTGEVAQVELQVANPDKVFEPYIEMYDSYVKRKGFEPITVSIVVINTADMDSGKAVVEHEYELKSPQVANEWASFTLGASNPYNLVFPNEKILKNFCRFRFKDRRCGYAGADSSCKHTLADCRKKKNSARFGGFPGIGREGVYIGDI